MSVPRCWYHFHDWCRGRAQSTSLKSRLGEPDLEPLWLQAYIYFEASAYLSALMHKIEARSDEEYQVTSTTLRSNLSVYELEIEFWIIWWPDRGVRAWRWCIWELKCGASNHGACVLWSQLLLLPFSSESWPWCSTSKSPRLTTPPFDCNPSLLPPPCILYRTLSIMSPHHQPPNY